MDIRLGMHVYTSDEQDLGAVDKLILDPTKNMVKAVIVHKGFFLPQDVEVPVEELTADASGNARIAHTADEIDRLPQFEEARYSTPPVGYLPPMGYPMTAIYLPLGYGIGGVPQEPSPVATGASTVDREVDAALRQHDFDNAVIGEGSDVLGSDGKKVGTVRKLTFDPDTSRIDGLVVHKGLFVGHEADVPVSLIDSVDDGIVYLKVAADEVLK